LETIEKEKKIGQKNLKIREWTEDEEKEIDNMVNSYYEL